MTRIDGAALLEIPDRRSRVVQAERPQGRPQIRILNGFEVCGYDHAIELPRSAQRLLAFLALNPRRVSRSYAAGTLWGEYTDERSTANLRSALWRVRKSECALVEVSPDLIRLASGVDVDVWNLLGLTRRLLDPTDACQDQLGATAMLALTSELLPDWHDDEWLIVEREHLRQLRQHALEALADRLIGMDRHGQAVVAALAAVEMEPLQESARVVLIRAHLLGGNRCQAVRQYEQYRNLLQSELGLDPSPHLMDLVAGLVRQ